MTDAVLYDEKEGVARLTLNRPARRNALDGEMIEALVAAFGRLRGAAHVRVIVLTGAGDRVFCAGGDLAGGDPAGKNSVGGDMAGGHPAESPVGWHNTSLADHYARGRFVDLFHAMAAVGRPIVVVVQGHALGGGFGLAMAGDVVIAAERACFGTPEIGVGLFPMMIMPILARYLPRRKLLEMMMTGERLSARDALSLGIVNQVVPSDRLQAAADVFIRKLLDKSPAALRLGRDAFYATLDLDEDRALRYLHSQLTLALMTDDAAEGISAFLHKRPPRWTGR